MPDQFLEFATAARLVDDWLWCGTAATEVGLVAATLAHKTESGCVEELRESSAAAGRRARGTRRLKARRADHSQALPAGRTAYQIAGNSLEQLWEYLRTGRQRLDAPLDERAGTGFQTQIWEALRRVPFGETRTYAWLAREIGNPQATQAAGTALSANNLLIFIPCHRVVPSRGVGGYSRGGAVKRRLLEHEQSWPRMRPLIAD